MFRSQLICLGCASQVRRRIYSSSIMLSSQREARMLQKLVSSKHDRKIWDSNTTKVTIKSTVGMMDKRRVAVLNKMFMENISQVMMHEEFEELIGKFGLVITKVSVQSQYKVLYVFWVANENESPIEVQNELSQMAGGIRQHLVNANIHGSVPEIRFVRDQDFVRVEETLHLLSHLKVAVTSDNEILEAAGEPTEPLEDVIPPMRMDVLGLDHKRVLDRIKTCKAKSFPLTFPDPSESVPMSSDSDTEKAIQDQILQQKKLRKFITDYKKSAQREFKLVKHKSEAYSDTLFDDASR